MEQSFHKERLGYFDAVKGFAIISIIIGHLPIRELELITYTFHVPIFFIVSGFFFNPQKSIVKRTWKILKPYLTCIILLLIGQTVLCSCYALTGGEFHPEYLIYWIMAGAWGTASKATAMGPELPLIGPIWFLVALCWTTIFTWIIFRISDKDWIRLVLAGLISFSGYILARRIWIPLSVLPGMLAAIYMTLGYMLRKYTLWQKGPVVLISFVFWMASIYLSFTTGELLSICRCAVPTAFHFIGSIGGSICIIYFFKSIDSKNYPGRSILLLFGEASLIVLSFHNLEYKLFDEFFRKIPIQNYIEYGASVLICLMFAFKLTWAFLGIKVHKRSMFLKKVL